MDDDDLNTLDYESPSPKGTSHRFLTDVALTLSCSASVSLWVAHIISWHGSWDDNLKILFAWGSIGLGCAGLITGLISCIKFGIHKREVIWIVATVAYGSYLVFEILRP